MTASLLSDIKMARTKASGKAAAHATKRKHQDDLLTVVNTYLNTGKALAFDVEGRGGCLFFAMASAAWPLVVTHARAVDEANIGKVGLGDRIVEAILRQNLHDFYRRPDVVPLVNTWFASRGMACDERIKEGNKCLLTVCSPMLPPPSLLRNSFVILLYCRSALPMKPVVSGLISPMQGL